MRTEQEINEMRQHLDEAAKNDAANGRLQDAADKGIFLLALRWVLGEEL